MTDIKRFRETPGRRISDIIKKIALYRGKDAEVELIQAFGEARLKAIYAGDEPRFSELEEIASILSVPLSTFQLSCPGDFPELEIAWMEILYHAYSLNRREREKLASDMTGLVPDPMECGNVLDLTRRQKNRRTPS
ncbi:hypothetical protein [Hyphobacterium sp.]|jgi:hypothetical protein|uniref:hypothetical protein n=1 Tax=Hyphobacterium sp. TaxID=2004662 RepID=UPI003BAAB961